MSGKSIRCSLGKWVSILFLVLCFSGRYQVVAEENIDNINDLFSTYVGDFTVDNDTLIDLLIRQQETKKTKRELILHYCDVILHTLD